ncbi:MAG: glycosyltransferase family 2 protein [Bacteroidia bacterium]
MQTEVISESGPFFTVVLTTYNRKLLLAQAIQSVLNQTYMDFELLVIDDGSDDGTGDSVSEYRDKRFNYVRQDNKGAGSARNKGISLAKGRYLCFLDDDDTFLPNHLFVLHSDIAGRDFPVAMFRTFARVQYHGQEGVDQQLTKRADLHSLEYIFKGVMYLPTVCLHRQIFLKYRFNEDLRLNIDYEMWIRVLTEFVVFEIGEITVIINFHSGGSVSAGSETAHARYIESWKVLFGLKEVKKYLPAKYRHNTLFKRYHWLAMEQANNGKRLDGFVSSLNAVRQNPGFVLDKNLYIVLWKLIQPAPKK